MGKGLMQTPTQKNTLAIKALSKGVKQMYKKGSLIFLPLFLVISFYPPRYLMNL